MDTAEIRRRWLRFFESRGHAVVPSAPLLYDDPTLLFVNAGMVPFKPYFLGQETPPFRRATSVQKCVRTLDIDEVGKTTRHGTFFQMNGNFSFGDYFKDGAIELAWELVTSSHGRRRLGLRRVQLWVTVYREDDEAVALWRTVTGLPDERILRRGMKDNYWSMGVPGPGRPVQRDLPRPRPRVRPGGRPGGRRGPLPGDLEPRLHAVRARRGRRKEDFDIRGELPSEEHRHRDGPGADGVPAAGRRQPLRDRRGVPGRRRVEELTGRRYGAVPRGRRAACGSSPTTSAAR